jgi:hypothetical protein
LAKYLPIMAAALALLANAPEITKSKSSIIKPVKSGIYSSVQISRETGDMGGFELELFADAPTPYVEAVWCEGWCNSSHRFPVTWTKSGFTFEYNEKFDTPIAPDSIMRLPFKVERKGQGLVLTTRIEDDIITFKLKRIKNANGLLVARIQHDK